MSVMSGIVRRQCVREDPMLWRETLAMQDAKLKVEIEELHAFGFDYLAQLVQYKIVHGIPLAKEPAHLLESRVAQGSQDGCHNDEIHASNKDSLSTDSDEAF